MAAPRSDRARPRSRPAAAGDHHGHRPATAAPALATIRPLAVRVSVGARTKNVTCPRRSLRRTPSRICAQHELTRLEARAAAAASTTIATQRSLPGQLGLIARSLRRVGCRASRRLLQRRRQANRLRLYPSSASASVRPRLLRPSHQVGLEQAPTLHASRRPRRLRPAARAGVSPSRTRLQARHAITLSHTTRRTTRATTVRARRASTAGRAASSTEPTWPRAPP